MDPDMINCMLLRILVEKSHHSQPCHLAVNQCKCKVWEFKKIPSEPQSTSLNFDQLSKDHRVITKTKTTTTMSVPRAGLGFKDQARVSAELFEFSLRVLAAFQP